VPTTTSLMRPTTLTDVVVTVAPSSGAVIVTRGGWGSTVTETVAVAGSPCASRATHAMTSAPSWSVRFALKPPPPRPAATLLHRTSTASLETVPETVTSSRLNDDRFDGSTMAIVGPGVHAGS